MQAHIFAGQGAQHSGMAIALLEHSETARRMFSQADAILGWSLTDLCTTGTQEMLTACAACQPAIFAVSVISFMTQRESLDVQPSDVYAGLSLGEWSALCCAEAMDFETGLRIVAKRGQLMDDCCQRHPGSMCAIIGADPAIVAAVCQSHGIDVANYNCPGQLIISGNRDAVQASAAELSPNAVKVVPLSVAGAYHSRLMQEAGEAFADYLQSIDLSLPKSTLYHNTTGSTAGTDVHAIKEIMARQIYSPVKWETCASAILGTCTAAHEYGPGKVLAGLCHRIDRKFPVASDNL